MGLVYVFPSILEAQRGVASLPHFALTPQPLIYTLIIFKRKQLTTTKVFTCLGCEYCLSAYK